ncbi:chitin deacetylase [Aspergillus candidus]|uniref:Glycoside hydrolase/deacetylase n=1 Tax=Aspergillus candidus TaxID=41067 RepID=A0A2I2FLB8_ASPCN|nr:glycoside hydrolase/deacetylase [Aspergillus candidus]PLB41410.1 glycoside hydrolase/deacetylase [Aspergillus candidus]
MADRQAVQQNVNSLLSKLDDPDPDMRYMSLNDLLGILSAPTSSFLSHDQHSSSRLADGLLKALDDQHGDVQNQALKCLAPLVVRLPTDSLTSILEQLSALTASQTVDTSVPNTALRTIVTALPRPQTGQPPSPEVASAYASIAKVLIPRLVGPTPSPFSRRGSTVKGMLEKDQSRGFSSDAIDVLIQVVTCFGALLKDSELTGLKASVMSIIDNDTAGTVVTKRALAAISALVLHFSDAQLSTFVSELVERFNSPQLSIVRRRHLIAAVGSIARSAPAKFGPHLPTLAPFVFSAVGETDLSQPDLILLMIVDSVDRRCFNYLLKLDHLILDRTCRFLNLDTVGRCPHAASLSILEHHVAPSKENITPGVNMHLSTVLALSGIGLLGCTTALHIAELPNTKPYNVVPVSGATSSPNTLTPRAEQARCGPGFGHCTDDNCCSTAGRFSTSHCRSPDCQIDFGHCDALEVPGGNPTDDVPRPKLGSVPYGPQTIRSCTKQGVVALTFDDGPREHTKDLLDLLDRYKAKATFFVTGNNNGKGEIDSPDQPWADLIRRMVNSGHQLASHTWSHQDLNKITHEQRLTQILFNEAALRNILGSFPTYMRPPYSSCTSQTGCLGDLGALGYHVILYDIDTEDFRHNSPDQIQKSKDIFNQNLDKKKPSWLVIAHDVHEQTVHNLTEHMLQRLAHDGFRAVTVGECLDDPPELWYRADDGDNGRLSLKSSGSSQNPKTGPTPNGKPKNGPKLTTHMGKSKHHHKAAKSQAAPVVQVGFGVMGLVLLAAILVQ